MQETVVRTIEASWLSYQSRLAATNVSNALDFGEKLAASHFDWPCMVSVTVLVLEWVQQMEKAMPAGEVADVGTGMHRMLLKLISYTSSKLTELQRKCINGLITLAVHYKDVSKYLQSRSCADTASFEWRSVLRMYLEVAPEATTI